jgi:hypothetical protein
MHNSRGYRDSAAECLLASQDAGQPSWTKVFHFLRGSCPTFFKLLD